ncbi:SDR family oxidoreductase [Jatrophihabitans sp. YIM 134969]
MSPAPVAVVTGGSAGIGRAVVREFAKRGVDVAVLARGEAGIAAAVAEVEEQGRRGLAVVCDVADPAAVDAAAERVEAELGPIAFWVNDAFVGALSTSWDLTDDEFDRITRVTYFGQVHGMRAALRHMRPRRAGSIVNVSSSLAHRGIPYQAAYCGAKHAIKGYTESVRAELLADDSPVTVSMVSLPGVNTPQFDWNAVHGDDDRHPMPVAPLYQPEVPARVIVDVAFRPRHDAWVGTPTALSVLGNRLAPTVVDWYLARTSYDAQRSDDPLPRAAENLDSPSDDTHDHGAHGAFDEIARTTDPVSWIGARVGRTVGRSVRVGLKVASAVLDLR